jgi:hypothetical protein
MQLYSSTSQRPSVTVQRYISLHVISLSYLILSFFFIIYLILCLFIYFLCGYFIYYIYVDASICIPSESYICTTSIGNPLCKNSYSSHISHCLAEFLHHIMQIMKVWTEVQIIHRGCIYIVFGWIEFFLVQ